MRVLITNFVLATRSGSELYVRDLATALLTRGHVPIVYAPVLGPLAEELRARTIPVVDDLRAVTTIPDIIHGHHNHETITALLRFPGVPAIRVCHGWLDVRPHQFQRIVRYVAVDHTVRDRMVCEWGIPEDRVDVIYNFVDLSKFPPRSELPAKPKRAVVFSNAASEHLATVERACAAVGISVDAVGADVGAIISDPGAVLRKYDVTFAKARCAMEAMAVGTAVILCDRSGLGPMVTLENFEALRRGNFGLRALDAPVTVDAITRQLAKYDPHDAAQVARRMRAVGGLDAAVDAMIALYEYVVGSWRESGGVAPEDELRSAAVYLQTIPGHPDVRAATAELLRALYFRCERSRFLRHLMPSPSLSRRIGKIIRRS